VYGLAAAEISGSPLLKRWRESGVFIILKVLEKGL